MPVEGFDWYSLAPYMNQGLSPMQKEVPQILTGAPSWPAAGCEGTAQVGRTVAPGRPGVPGVAFCAGVVDAVEGGPGAATRGEGRGSWGPDVQVIRASGPARKRAPRVVLAVRHRIGDLSRSLTSSVGPHP
jgi:hypothetical protein